MIFLEGGYLRNFAMVQPVFMKCFLCAIYSPICKLGKNILNVTTVKLLPKNKIQCFYGFFDALLFQTLF